MTPACPKRRAGVPILQPCADTQELRRALVPRLCLGTQGDEALPRVSMSDAKLDSLRSALEAEPLELAFPGEAWERVGAAGQVIQDTDAKNAITSSTYDALNRRLTIQWPDHVAGTCHPKCAQDNKLLKPSSTSLDQEQHGHDHGNNSGHSQKHKPRRPSVPNG